MGRPYTYRVEAWEDFMRGLALYRLYKKEANAQARELFEKAINLDPEFARAYAMLAATHRQDGNQEWTQDRDISEALAYHLAHYAVELAKKELEPKPSLPYALEQWAWVLLYQEHNREAALMAAQEAVGRQPNFANGHGLEAHILTYLGDPEASLRKANEALRLDPKAVLHDHYHRGHAYYVRGYLTGESDVAAARPYYQEAEKHLREALRRNNNFRPARSFLVAVLWELGQWEPDRREEAKQEMAILRDTGRPQAFQNLQRFQDYVKRGNPYENKRITERLMYLWQAAESRP
jgi:adenylate cyclase